MRPSLVRLAKSPTTVHDTFDVMSPASPTRARGIRNVPAGSLSSSTASEKIASAWM